MRIVGREKVDVMDVDRGAVAVKRETSLAVILTNRWEAEEGSLLGRTRNFKANE